LLIAVLSTLISSVALIGVVVSLFLQARQLRANQIQIARASQVELLKFYFENTSMVADWLQVKDVKQFDTEVLANWYVTHLSLTYENRAVSKAYLKNMAAALFASESSRVWWAAHGDTYSAAATSRRDKDFFTILDLEFQRASHVPEAAVPNGSVPPDASTHVNQ
jgi:hypothetical protein